MVENYLIFIPIIAVGGIILLGLLLDSSGAGKPKTTPNHIKYVFEMQKPTLQQSESVGSGRLPAENGNNERISSLRQNLRLKVLYDEAKIDRLIDFERRRNPNVNLIELMQDAIDRYERDNH